jgi:4-alpha-glucanotransferase
MERRLLRNLARLYGIETAFKDVWGRWRETSQDTLLRTLQLLGAPVASLGDVPDALRQRRRELWQEVLEPVCVAWEGMPAQVSVRLTETDALRAFRWGLQFEDGGRSEGSGRLAELPTRRQRDQSSASVPGGARYVVKLLGLPTDLPRGYHRLALEFGGRSAETLLIVSPVHAYREARRKQRHLWGVFLPLYALNGRSSWAGDFSDLKALMQWTAEQGGGLVATLPLLSTLWELSDDPSPYSPASRLFWNEFYLDPRQIPEFGSCPAAETLAQAADLETPGEGRSKSGKRKAESGKPLPLSPFSSPGGPGPREDGPSPLVDYTRQMHAKRQLLEALAATFFQRPAERRQELARYCQANPEVELFSRFRAVGERQGRPWPQWPEPLRDGMIRPGDYDETVYRYHLYAQWQVAQQLGGLADHARRWNLLWYLDFPLGVSGEGYDVWRQRDLFVREASGGAPPDAFFTKGQNWGFPPLRPEALRRQGYRYFIRALRTQLQYARVLRLDHVMGLYRLYWIPHGFAADDGAYVRYRMQELLAILTLESHRLRARVVGENLGTVPEVVDDALGVHAIEDMYVLQYETNPDKGPTLRPVPPTSVASVNTHDMPPFAGYWRGLDIQDRVDLELFTAEEAARERARRARLREDVIGFLRGQDLLDAGDPQVEQVMEACHAYLARSPAGLVLINLEDLWGETEPQNWPGTYRQRPNWRRKARYSFDQFSELPAVVRVLSTVNRLRKQADTATEGLGRDGRSEARGVSGEERRSGK